MEIFKLTPKTLIAVLFVVAIVPMNVLAVSDTDSSEASTPNSGEKTQTRTQLAPVEEKKSEQKQQLKCQAITEMGVKIKEKISQRKVEIESKRSKVQKNTVERQDERGKTLLTKRAEWDAQRQENFTKLRAKATTDAQKAAVEVYIKTVTAAIAKHRASNDSAFAEFRASMITIKSGVSQSVKVNITNSSTQVEDAIAAAKIACTNGQSVDSVRQGLRAQLQIIQTDSKQERQSINISQQIKESVQKRKDSVKASAVVFDAAMQQAREVLLVAFKDDVQSVE